MPFDEFPLLQDNTRLLRHKETLYKVKVKYEELRDKSQVKNLTRKKSHDQIENTFRALLYIIQREETLDLKPIQTENFLITIVTAPWIFCKKYGFTQNGKELKGYPLQFEFNIKFQKSERQEEKTDDVVVQTTKTEINKVAEVLNDSSEGTNEVRELDFNRPAISGPRFTRSDQGSLLLDGKRVISKETANIKVSDSAENTSLKVTRRVQSNELNKIKDRDRLKRKVSETEDNLPKAQCVKPKWLRSSDKGLEVERFHNRNNSNVSVSPRYSRHRLKLRNSREPLSEKRHSVRLKSKASNKESSSEISEAENEAVKKNQSRNSSNVSVSPRYSRHRLKIRKSKEKLLETRHSVRLRSKAVKKESPSEILESENEDKRSASKKNHNRNNSNVTVSPRYSGHRLRIRKSVEPLSEKRHAIRLRSMSVDKKSSSEISDSEGNGKSVNKRHVNKLAAKKRDKSDLGESDSNAIQINKNHNTQNTSTGRTRKRRRETFSKVSDVESASEIETDDKRKNAGQKDKTRPGENFTENVNSPRVSTVLPQKRPKPQLDFQSPRVTRQQALARSPVDHVDFITSSRPATTQYTIEEEEGQRILRMRQQVPRHTYQNILLAQSRDRHMIEQAERAETDKLRQLYEPTTVRRSPRLGEDKKDKSFFHKVFDTILTPLKMMTGNKRRWSDIY